MKENIKEIYYKYKIILIPAIVGIICLAVLVLIVYPQAQEYFLDRGKIDTLISRTEILNNKAKELQNIDEEARKKDLVIALTVLPTERDVPKAMSALQDLVVKSSLVLKNTTYTPTSKGTKSTGKDSFMFTISVIGSLSSIKNFLNELQSGSRIFKVESITLNFHDAGSMVEASIPLLIFYESVPKAPMTLDQPITTISDADEQLIGILSKSVFQTETTSASSSSTVPLGKVDPFE